MADIEIEIDGKKLQASPNAMVIQVADAAGIYIPRFCYHKHLSIAANCRMCLVEVEKSPKTLPACATPVMAGMKVFTRSPKALAAQKAVMEFLLINHPLDCPICDQGGECELQDLSLGFGGAESFYTEGKRAVKDKDIGPLIETEMTRCIHCTRCVRFGAEVAGMRELGATGRGEHMEIGTYIEHAMKSEISGNVIDLCPVGALTSKPFRFTARPWELDQRATISPHDCVGANLNAHTRYGTLMRMVPRENVSINETWISDRDRFSYQGLYHDDRILKPLIKKDGSWIETDWLAALEAAAEGLHEYADTLGALIAPNATTEEFYLLQKILRAIGCGTIDYRLRQTDFSDEDQIDSFSQFGLSFAELEKCDAILLVGSNLQKEQPTVFTRVRKAYLQGAKIMAVNVMDYTFNVDLVAKQIVAPDELVSALGSLANVIVQVLQNAKKVCVIVGSAAFNHPEAAMIRKLVRQIANAYHGHVGFLTEGANAAGANLSGALPNHGGLNAVTMLQACKAFVLFNVEPDLDCANPVATRKALAAAKCVVSFSTFMSPAVREYAQVILPISPFTETAGSFINVCGDWQTFTGVATPHGDSRPAWKVLRVLANLMDLEGFEFKSWDEVHAELKSFAANKKPAAALVDGKVSASDFKKIDKQKLFRVGDIPIYAVDGLVRRAKALQAAQPIVEGDFANARLHPETATRLQFSEGDLVTVTQVQGEVTLPVVFDERVPLRAVFIAGALQETAGLSQLFGEVELKKTM